jgi:hypothetical protein
VKCRPWCTAPVYKRSSAQRLMHAAGRRGPLRTIGHGVKRVGAPRTRTESKHNSKTLIPGSRSMVMESQSIFAHTLHFGTLRAQSMVQSQQVYITLCTRFLPGQKDPCDC